MLWDRHLLYHAGRLCQTLSAVKNSVNCCERWQRGRVIISTMNDRPGCEVEEVLGEVFGLTVRSRNLGSVIGAALKSLSAASCAA